MNNISFRNDILPLKNVLFRLALRITLNREDAEDVVQDTLVKVWNKRDDWHEIDSIEAFCMTVCRNLSLDKVKKASRSTGSWEQTGTEAADRTGADPYDRIVQRDRFDTVRRLMNALPEKQRTCMQLRDFEGKSYKDIAAVMNITEEQVKVSIFRARQTIKQKYVEIDKYGL